MHNKITVRVSRKRIEATGVCSFELTRASGGDLPAFTAGSHIDVAIADGVTRQYSLCNDPVETHRYLIGVLLEADSRGGSKWLHDSVREGGELEIGEPRNLFALAAHASWSVLVAGGIGITPILAMAAKLQRDGSAFELHYCTRDAQRAAFADYIRSSLFADATYFHLDDGPALQKFSPELTLGQPGAGSHLYVCGPAGFIDWVLSTARAAGWPADKMHREYFAAAKQDLSGDREFNVKLGRSGRMFTIGATQSVTDVLASNGIEIPMSCEQGVCGTCVTKVLEGVPDHRDMFLTARERAANDRFTPCCSRALSPMLIIDL